jgi:hypothetical protein
VVPLFHCDVLQQRILVRVRNVSVLKRWTARSDEDSLLAVDALTRVCQALNTDLALTAKLSSSSGFGDEVP